MPKTIITELKLLNELKKQQIRRQVPSLALLALSFMISILLPLFFYHYPSLILAILSFVWFRVVAANFRCKQKLIIPDGNLLLSPVTGRVRSIKTAPDYTLVRIGKSPIDYIEIRSPHDSAQWDNGTIKLQYMGHNLIFRFDSSHLQQIDSTDMQAGNIIGYIIGSAVCSISIPRELALEIKPKTICDAGLTALVSE